MKITVLLDTPKSWMMPYAQELVTLIGAKGHTVHLIHDHRAVEPGDMMFILSCEQIIKPDILQRNTKNIVAHASDLPKGRGWSPLTWRILEGKNEIAISLLEAAEKVDRGDIYLQETIQFQGDELIDELRDAMAKKINELILRFIERYSDIKGRTQVGEPTYYSRRSPLDSELNIDKSLKDQFNALRTVDNERYPAFFKYRDYTYIIKIYKSTKKINDAGLSLRKVTADDARRVWEIRNNTMVQEQSLHQNVIPFEQHYQWFQQQYFTTSQNKCFVLTKDNHVIGYCRFDAQSPKLFRISIAIDPDFHGQGFGKQLLRQSLERLLPEENVIAEIKKENIKSIHLFKKNAFVIDRQDEENYYLAYRPANRIIL